MSLTLDRCLRGKGTKFMLFAQPPFMEGYEKPETVWVSPPAGRIAAGPADHRMYVRDPDGPKDYYEHPDGLPYRGPVHPPAVPDIQGHFDHIHPGERQFLSAHMFGTVRRVLDIWEDYFGGTIPWHFRMTHQQLEMIPTLDWNNAQFGWGFMEAGYGKDDKGKRHSYALNFDVLAHEAGHGLIFSMVGIPSEETVTAEYRGFHESASDLVALFSVLHFDSFIERLLKNTAGNLYVENALNRIGELSRSDQIRLASNSYRMSDCADPATPVGELSYKQVHKLGEPLTGAFFDIFVEIYQRKLSASGAISRQLNHDSSRTVAASLDTPGLQDRYRKAYDAKPHLFRTALQQARDAMGVRLAETWRRIPADHLTFAEVAKTFLTVDRLISGSAHQRSIIDNFHWREIGYGFPRKTAKSGAARQEPDE